MYELQTRDAFTTRLWCGDGSQKAIEVCITSKGTTDGYILLDNRIFVHYLAAC
jgi:hypothetical protein